ncbi:MAG TPA: hypothetical protein VK133_01085 [Amoebophilaceae bacterium]|nr:hypothetical protein [Amoebophilaceae bacterium]
MRQSKDGVIVSLPRGQRKTNPPTYITHVSAPSWVLILVGLAEP